jgi:hypothetical protein
LWQGGGGRDSCRLWSSDHRNENGDECRLDSNGSRDDNRNGCRLLSRGWDDRSNDTEIGLQMHGVTHALAHLSDGESVAATWVVLVVRSDMSLDMISSSVVSVDWHVDNLDALSLGLTFCTFYMCKRYNSRVPYYAPFQGAS